MRGNPLDESWEVHWTLKRTCPCSRRVAHATDFLRWGMFPLMMMSAQRAYRMRLAHVPADRSQCDVKSHARGFGFRPEGRRNGSQQWLTAGQTPPERAG